MTGEQIWSIRIEGVSATGQTVYDLTLGDVAVTKVDDTVGGLDKLAFGFDQVTLATVGAGNKTTKFGWDFAHDVAVGRIDAPQVRGQQEGGAATDFNFGRPVDYYLTIDSVAGEGAEGHRGAIKVASFIFDLETLLPGQKAEPPVTVDFNSSVVLPAVLAGIASGKHIGAVRIEGVDRATQTTVYDLRLGDVAVTQVHDTDDSGGGNDSLSFSYGQITLATRQVGGSIDSPKFGLLAGFGWDISNDVAITPSSIRAANPSGRGTIGSNPALTYYLTIDGMTGGVKDPPGAFAVTNFNFDVGMLIGRADFQPLTVDLVAGSGLAGLLADAVTAQHIPSIRIEGVTSVGGIVAYDLELGDVVVGVDGGGVKDRLSFDYGMISLTTWRVSQDGAVDPPVRFSAVRDGAHNKSPLTIGDTDRVVAGEFVIGNVLKNDSDPEGDRLVVGAVDRLAGNGGTWVAGAYGRLDLSEDGIYRYEADAFAPMTARAGSHPHDTFVYTAIDGKGGGADAVLDIMIDRLPIAVGDLTTAMTGKSVTGNVLANDDDPDDDGLVVSAVSGRLIVNGVALAGAYGLLTLSKNGAYTYLADNIAAIAAAKTGSHPHDVFAYTVSDGLDGAADTTLDITIDRLPVAVGDFASVKADQAVTGNVLANDGDADGDSLAVRAVAGFTGNVGVSLAGSYGHLTLGTNGVYSYTADNAKAIAAAATGSHLHDIFVYTASDGLGGTADAELDVTLDRPVVAVGDHASVKAGQAVSRSVLANDSDADGNSLVVSAVAGLASNVGVSLAGAYGHLTLAKDGSYSYLADKTAPLTEATMGSHLHDIFRYTANDGMGSTVNATLDITVDRPPVAVGDLAGVQVGQAVVGNVLTND